MFGPRTPSRGSRGGRNCRGPSSRVPSVPGPLPSGLTALQEAFLRKLDQKEGNGEGNVGLGTQGRGSGTREASVRSGHVSVAALGGGDGGELTGRGRMTGGGFNPKRGTFEADSKGWIGRERNSAFQRQPLSEVSNEGIPHERSMYFHKSVGGVSGPSGSLDECLGPRKKNGRVPLQRGIVMHLLEGFVESLRSAAGVLETKRELLKKRGGGVWDLGDETAFGQKNANDAVSAVFDLTSPMSDSSVEFDRDSLAGWVERFEEAVEAFAEVVAPLLSGFVFVTFRQQTGGALGVRGVSSNSGELCLLALQGRISIHIRLPSPEFCTADERAIGQQLLLGALDAVAESADGQRGECALVAVSPTGVELFGLLSSETEETGRRHHVGATIECPELIKNVKNGHEAPVETQTAEGEAAAAAEAGFEAQRERRGRKEKGGLDDARERAKEALELMRWLSSDKKGGRSFRGFSSSAAAGEGGTGGAGWGGDVGASFAGGGGGIRGFDLPSAGTARGNCVWKPAETFGKSPRARAYYLLRECQAAVSSMNMEGIGFDREGLMRAVEGWRRELGLPSSSSSAAAGGMGLQTGGYVHSNLDPSLNVRSNKQLGEFLEARLPKGVLSLWPRTKTGQLRTDKETLRQFSAGGQGGSQNSEGAAAVSVAVRSALAEVERRRILEKKLSFFGPFGTLSTGGRLYPQYSLGGACTGRLTCRNPNVQCASRDESFRGLFRAPPGRVLVVGDFSQVELRVLAEISGDRRMRDAFDRGADLHTVTAASILSISADEVSKQQRQIAKSVNFGLVYGQSVEGLRRFALSSFGVQLRQEEAAAAAEGFFKAYPGVAAWQKECRERTGACGFTETPGGRRRTFQREDRWLAQQGGGKGQTQQQQLGQGVQRASGGQTARVARVQTAQQIQRRAGANSGGQTTSVLSGNWASESLNFPIQGGAAEVMMTCLALLWRRMTNLFEPEEEKEEEEDDGESASLPQPAGAPSEASHDSNGRAPPFGEHQTTADGFRMNTSFRRRSAGRPLALQSLFADSSQSQDVRSEGEGDGGTETDFGFRLLRHSRRSDAEKMVAMGGWTGPSPSEARAGRFRNTDHSVSGKAPAQWGKGGGGVPGLFKSTVGGGVRRTRSAEGSSPCVSLSSRSPPPRRLRLFSDNSADSGPPPGGRDSNFLPGGMSRPRARFLPTEKGLNDPGGREIFLNLGPDDDAEGEKGSVFAVGPRRHWGGSVQRGAGGCADVDPPVGGRGFVEKEQASVDGEILASGGTEEMGGGINFLNRGRMSRGAGQSVSSSPFQIGRGSRFFSEGSQVWEGKGAEGLDFVGGTKSLGWGLGGPGTEEGPGWRPGHAGARDGGGFPWLRKGMERENGDVEECDASVCERSTTLSFLPPRSRCPSVFSHQCSRPPPSVFSGRRTIFGDGGDGRTVFGDGSERRVAVSSEDWGARDFGTEFSYAGSLQKKSGFAFCSSTAGGEFKLSRPLVFCDRGDAGEDSNSLYTKEEDRESQEGGDQSVFGGTEQVGETLTNRPRGHPAAFLPLNSFRDSAPWAERGAKERDVAVERERRARLPKFLWQERDSHTQAAGPSQFRTQTHPSSSETDGRRAVAATSVTFPAAPVPAAAAPVKRKVNFSPHGRWILVGVVHDEFLLEVPQEDVQAASDLLRECMEAAWVQCFPRTGRAPAGLAEVNVGQTWGDAKS